MGCGNHDPTGSGLPELDLLGLPQANKQREHSCKFALDEAT